MDTMHILEDAAIPLSRLPIPTKRHYVGTLSGITTVLTDINMPGSMDGLQLSRLIRDRWPLIGLVITSGRYLAKAAQMPAGVQFIAKPYTPSEIVSALQNCAA